MKLTLTFQTFLLILFLVALASWTASRFFPRLPAPTSYFTEGRSVAAQDKPYVPVNDEESNNIEIYKRVSPAVVNITSTTVDFDFFFNAMPKQGSGSGSIIDAEGHILTNYHVIEGAKKAAGK